MQSNNYFARIISLVMYLLGLYFIFSLSGHPILSGSDIDLILFSSVALLAINLFIIEHFFGTPKDAISNSINAMILMIALYNNEGYSKNYFYILFIYYALVLVISILSALLLKKDKISSIDLNKISHFLKEISVFFGKSKLIFSLLIISLLIEFYTPEAELLYLLLIIYLALLFSDDLRKGFIKTIALVQNLFSKKSTLEEEAIGIIAAVQSNDVFVVDLSDVNKRPSLELFDFIKFKYEINRTEKNIVTGFIIDRYLLDSQQKIKVLRLKNKSADKDEKNKHIHYKNNIAYKIQNPSEENKKELENFVGTVTDKSNISQIRFEYSSKEALKVGRLLEVKSDKNEGIIYQITQATTDIKKLENKNEAGIIISNATQVGIWQDKERSFERYDWVPSINAPVYIAGNIKGPECKEEEIKFGTMEGAEFDVLANIKDLITHHTAILGVTGSGKSVLAREIIKKVAKNNTKVFCIDLTGEIKRSLKPETLIDSKKTFAAGGRIYTQDNKKNECTLREEEEKKQNISKHIKTITDLRKKDYGKDPRGFQDLVDGVEEEIKKSLENFIKEDNCNIGVLEIPELSNTEETLEFTKMFFKVLFDLAKDKNFKEKKEGLIVLEEAHTLIPEWNSVGGTDDKTARRLTNTIAQIALQGRKYHIGLLVIAQRTANVSKTILTQCNTIISFRQFDNTSRDFLINYFGGSLALMLPTLKNRMAIIYGKALISNVPLIFKVPEIKEDVIVDESKQQEENK